MKKKNKIIGTVSALAVSMAMLTGGVLAASSVSLSVNSTVSFEASGVYVMAEGSVLRGASTSSLSALEESDRPESDVTVGASYTYKGHSYTPTSASDDTPNGGSYTPNMLAWTVGTVEFTESEKVIQYKLNFTNYSEFNIDVTVNDNIGTIESVTTDKSATTMQVNAKGGTAEYTLTLTLNNVASSINFDIALNVNVVEHTISPDEYTSPNLNVDYADNGLGTNDSWVTFKVPAYAKKIKYELDTGGSNEIEAFTVDLTEIYGDGKTYSLDSSSSKYDNFYEDYGGSGSGSYKIRVQFVDANGYTSPWSEWTTCSWEWMCLTGDTLITMSDGKKKRLKDLKKGDKVLGVDPETGELVATEVTATDTDEVKFKDEYTIWYLSDGTKIKTVNKHRFYNVREKKMMFMEEWQIGDEFVKEDGTKVKLEKKRTIHRRVRHFTLNTTTETYFANGMLSGNYHTKPMASETFKFMK